MAWDGHISYCTHCGERTKGKYCKTCSTAAGRSKIDAENIAIMKENIAKGFSYNHPHFDRLKKLAKIDL